VQRIAIAGATGYIGGRLAPRLLEAGYSLRCLVRSPRKLEGRDWTSDPRVEVWPSDLDVHPSLTRDLSGCDVAFYLVHSMMSSDRAYAEHDLALARTFAAAARDAGVGRIIYLSGLGEMGSGLSEHLESRRHVETALASTGVPVTVLRGHDHRFGFGLVRDHALPGAAPAGHDHADLGQHALSTDRD